MMLYNPSLEICKVLAIKNNKEIYNETFHSGINILSGRNGTGKTSILQLIVYGLGYEITKWKNEAGSCDYIYLGIKINNISITLRRNINNKEKQSISICFSNLDNSLLSPIENWMTFQYSSSYGNISFSKKIFELLNIPEAKADSNNNIITMHQILRVIYGDQSNPSGYIFNIESFDSAFKRESIGNYLLGLYDNDLYNDKISLINEDKKITKLIAKISAIHSIIGKTSFSTNENIIENEKKIYLDKIKELNINILEKKVNILGTYPNEKKSSENIAKKNILIKTNLFECESKIREMMYDIDDSEQFIKELENKQKSLQDAILVNSSLKGFIFDTCPCCQNKLKNRLHNECSLCGNELIEEGTNKNLLRMKNEIDLQLIESNKILLKDKIDFNNLKQEKKQIRTELRKTIVESSSVITSLNSNNENLLYSNYQQIGSLEEKILHLDKIKELLESISLLTNERDEIQLKINRLKDNIEKKKNLYRIREPEIKKIISEELISILRLDIGSEKEFKQAETVDFDFASNSISINGKSAFSESGMIFLYNSFKLALLLASLKKEYVRIPRFMILDGIENGGMEDSRSKNFQKIIHDKLLNSNVEFQIIFATKSIEPSLDNCDYIIGDTFSENKKSLNV